MNELLVLERAKAYIVMLSKGIDPISGEAVPKDSVLSNERLRKCFDYVGGILQKVIDNEGEVVCVNEKLPFSIPSDKKRLITISQTPITSTEFVKRINAFIDSSTTKRLTSRPIMRWLLSNNYLAETEVPVQMIKKVNVLCGQSAKIGIEIRQRVVKSTGEVKDEFVFTREGQQFILDHIDEIISGEKPEETMPGDENE